MPTPFWEMPDTLWSSKIPKTMSPCAPYWHRCIPTKDGVPSWKHIINAPRDLSVIWPLMYILQVTIIRDLWVTCCDIKVAFTVTDRTIMDDDSRISISNYGFDDYFMQENDLEDDDANRFSPNDALENVLGSTAPLGVSVGSSPTPITSLLSTTIEAGPSGLNTSFTTNTFRKTSPYSTAPTATPVVPNLPPSSGKEDDNNNNNINDMHRQLRLLSNDQQNATAGQRIASITKTNTITTTYKDNGHPTVKCHSTSTHNW